MPECRILYFRGGILEDTSEPLPGDLVEAARMASSTHPHLTAEIWLDGHKAAIVRPARHEYVSRRARAQR
jgi:hypothetical protein